MKMRKLFAALLLGVLGATIVGCADANDNAGLPTPQSTSGQHLKTPAKKQVKAMKIRLKLDNTTLSATLDDNPTARDFISLLPLTLTLKDHAQTEKVGDLPKKLSTQGAPEGHDPQVGEIAYYAPWGNLAMYLKDFEYSSGLVRLGKFDSGLEALKQPGPLKVTIERIEK